MKRKSMNFFEAVRRLAIAACGIAFITLVIAVPFAPAQEVNEEKPLKADKFLDILERQKKAIVGSWFVHVETPPFPPLKVLLTFTNDGNAIATAQGDVTPMRALSVAQGAWSHQAGRMFASTLLQISYEIPTSNFRGILKVRLTHNLNSAGDEWDGPYKLEFLSPAGTSLFSADGTTLGRRIKVEPLP
jgi:hypothetical protein